MNASRIAPLDALRGLAALVVVVYHYRFLAPAGSRPFEAALAGIYEYGTLAVPLFYTLSGYIFFDVYARAPREGGLSAREFFWLRTSRLYPLHLLTLFIVAGLQAMVWRARGGYLEFPHNDAVHFLLNLGFLQFGWWDRELSFNAPTWSLSVEAWLYVVFFVFARSFGAARAPRLALGALFLALVFTRTALPGSGPLNWHFVQGLGCFFLGGCLQLTQGWPDRMRLAAGIVLMEAGFGLIYLVDGRSAPMVFLSVLFGGLMLTWLGSRGLGRVAASRPLVWLGDISYSVYLWHFPVQLVMVLVSTTFVPIAFSSPVTLFVYLATTLGLSTLSYRYFEIPARTAMRRWATGRTLAPAVA